MQQLIWVGKNKELTVPRVLQWPTFFTPTEMLPVERMAVDWERGAKLAPLYSLAFLGQSCLNKIGAAHHWPSSVWTGRKTIKPLRSYIKPQITPPSPLIFAILNGGWTRQIWDHHMENPRKILAIWLGGWGGDAWGVVWFGSFLQRLMVFDDFSKLTWHLGHVLLDSFLLWKAGSFDVT